MRRSILALTCALVAQVVFANELADWDQLYYPGLEASGEVKVNPTGFRGTDPAIELAYLSGMPNFGVRKTVKSELKGCVEWKVSARLKCEPGGSARASMEFFDAKGKTLGRQDGPRRIYTNWERTVWTFTSPRAAVRGEVHLVNCERTKVSFARVEISSAPGIDKGELPFKMAVLPVLMFPLPAPPFPEIPAPELVVVLPSPVSRLPSGMWRLAEDGLPAMKRRQAAARSGSLPCIMPLSIWSRQVPLRQSKLQTARAGTSSMLSRPYRRLLIRTIPAKSSTRSESWSKCPRFPRERIAYND